MINDILVRILDKILALNVLLSKSEKSDIFKNMCIKREYGNIEKNVCAVQKDIKILKDYILAIRKCQKYWKVILTMTRDTGAMDDYTYIIKEA